MAVPSGPLRLMAQIYRKVLPQVHGELENWKKKARAIPDPELRRQALASLQTKAFHCEGGAIYSLLAGEKRSEVISFIVAYQTISDYLDNLCDRSVSLDPVDFRRLHSAMLHALTPGTGPSDYYQYRDVSSDGGYLQDLVSTCQGVLSRLTALGDIQPALHELAGFYCDLQVHKHVEKDQRVPRLIAWFQKYKNRFPEMSWYEFAACSGSTLGIFCIVSYAAARGREMGQLVQTIKNSYFPWVQGLHILMDYFVDQEEDKQEGDLNFCFYYNSEEEMMARFNHFIEEADAAIDGMPDRNFHKMINRGLLGIYLADRKVARQRNVRVLARKLIRRSGGCGLFFFVNGWIYRRLRQSV
ncbi:MULTISPECIES: tetraprenyl-beta-curcumene synthase family protein [unclassified Sporolactobacillus]|uniref:tetraprenyl-beta-curcumene synthase family protein n=1 Tax=unclassified Sporolactobacillus TaxID=2628533 RepID=UPI00236884AD|nr:tetraprenyl-beta-curcumene synthase family protein [Sporolactobacillus sp. CQH2019]MDD9149474.1 tetraprenyl-beta-curcumene synthase family protein [Sporolactobacillus sp. CQH2019]